MLKTDYTIKKGQNLSDIMSRIESNTNLAKRLPGIGATYLEIISPRSSLLIEPHVPVIQGKCKKHKKDNLLGVYEGVTTDMIIRYLREPHKFDKIMTTPEGFQKVMLAAKKVGIDPYLHFFCLMDESHLMVKDVDYRNDIVLPMDDFFKFKNKALVSATPIEFSDPRFIEQGFKIVNIHPKYDCRQQIDTIHTNNVLQTTKDFIKGHNNPICIFLNLTDYIISLIRQLGIEKESAVFCAPKSQDKLKHEFNFNNAYDMWDAKQMKRYNFFTGRFFTAFDLDLNYLPDILMITDAKASHYTILDINTDCIQIAGRFRNGLTSLTHIYTTDSDIPIRTQEEVQNKLEADKNVYNTIRSVYSSASSLLERKAYGDVVRSLPFNNLLYPNGSKNYFAIDNKINEALVTSCYHDSDRIEKAYYENRMFLPACIRYEYPYEEFERFKLQHSKMTIKIKREKMIEILSTLTEPLAEGDINMINEMRTIDSLLVEAYEELGIDKIKELDYSSKTMKETIILKKKTCNSTIKLIKNSFSVGCKYKCSTIKREISRIFEILNIHPEKEIRGETIKDYFYTEPCQIGKKRERGYIITDSKL